MNLKNRLRLPTNVRRGRGTRRAWRGRGKFFHQMKIKDRTRFFILLFIFGKLEKEKCAFNLLL